MKNRNKDLTAKMSEFARDESAIFAVSFMKGNIFKGITKETLKTDPDENKIKNLRKELKKLDAERDLMYSGDIATKNKIINNYAPIIKSMLESKNIYFKRA